MAMAMAQAWDKKKISSWADESEASDTDLPPPPPPIPAPAPAAPDDDFPSLSKPGASGPKKKNKGQTLTLAQFTTGKQLGPGANRRSSSSVSSGTSSTGIFMSNDRLTPDELLYLPTGPKERSGDEPQFGGGFRSYGSGGFRQERPREREPLSSMPPPPSRADESSDWFSGRNAPRRMEQHYPQHPQASKADEVESWSHGKTRLGRAEVEPGSGWNRRATQGGEDERWPRRIEDEAPQRRKLNLQPRSLPVESSPGAAVPTTPPAPVPPTGLNPSSRASSGEFSSRPGTPSSPMQSESKPRVNPFGSAKPREMVLQERGQDWRKLDQEMERKRYESDEEKRLKQEILRLKEEVIHEGTPEVKQRLENREQELAQLIKDLDSKARLSEQQQQQQQPGMRIQSSHDAWSRPPSSHGIRGRNNNVNSSEMWRRPRTPMQENEWSRRGDAHHFHRPRTASGDYYNRPRTPDLWRRESSEQHNHYHNFSSGGFNNSNENEFGRADMWSRPRTPSVHDPDEWHSGRSSAATTPTTTTATRW